MSWGAWFVMGYLALGCWTATGALLFGMPVAKDKPLKAGLLAIPLMWTLPALLLGALFLKGRNK
ncbi:MAG: hypothetical protein GYB50_04075 [Rhodobacteraceae bacterium]|nr:hypothetical protein [Paracoccaceae bacterium]